jgi:hypothetical protein
MVIFKLFGKFAEIFARHGAPLVSTTLVANLPPISTTPAENWPLTPLVSLIQVAIMGTISDCLHLKGTSRKKCIYVLTLLPKGVQTKNI